MFCYLEGRGLILVLTQGGNQLAVFGLGADGDAQAVLTELHAVAVANDDALIHQIVVDLVGIGHLGQEEVGIRRINLLADREYAEGLHHAAALLLQNLYPTIYFEWVLQCLECLLLGEQVDIVMSRRILLTVLGWTFKNEAMSCKSRDRVPVPSVI